MIIIKIIKSIKIINKHIVDMFHETTNKYELAKVSRVSVV